MPIAAVRTSCFLLYSRNVLQIAVNGAEVSRVANLGLLLCPIIDSSQSVIREEGRRYPRSYLARPLYPRRDEVCAATNNFRLKMCTRIN